MALDNSIAEMNSNNNRINQSAIIKIKLNNVWVDCEVDVASLRSALRLPQHDIFTEGIFQEFVPVSAPAQDMQDVDHQQENELTYI